jgi:tRNA A37 methylthiotransferase MiaB
MPQRTILKPMTRAAAAVTTLERIAAWEGRGPRHTIRSTFIGGFPGERRGLRRAAGGMRRAARSGRVPEYSPVAAPPPTDRAACAAGARGSEGERRARFMELPSDRAARLAEKIGRTMRVLIDRVGGAVSIKMFPGTPRQHGTVRIRGAGKLRRRLGAGLDHRRAPTIRGAAGGPARWPLSDAPCALESPTKPRVD